MLRFPPIPLSRFAHLTLDGGERADVRLDVGLAVQQTVLEVNITRCRVTGLCLPGSQNNAVIWTTTEGNGSAANETEDAGIELVEGAGNNAFFRVEMNRNGGHQLAIRSSGVRERTFPAGRCENGF